MAQQAVKDCLDCGETIYETIFKTLTAIVSEQAGTREARMKKVIHLLNYLATLVKTRMNLYMYSGNDFKHTFWCFIHACLR